jgi:DNA-binding NarL/FixJ family response regulator
VFLCRISIEASASTKEISRALYISEYNVQDHSSYVFEKVGERGRRALVKRLYLESLFY